LLGLRRAWKPEGSRSTHGLRPIVLLWLPDHFLELDLVDIGVDGLHLVHVLGHQLSRLDVQFLLVGLLELLPLQLQELALLIRGVLVLRGQRSLSDSDLPLELLLGLELWVAHSLLVGRGGRHRLSSLLLRGTSDEDLLLPFGSGLRVGAVVLAH
jgi:hypothetical protein